MTYQLSQSRQLMENHIPADVLDAREGFASFQTPAGAVALLAIGNDLILRASVETAGTTTGWTTADLSTDLAASVQALCGQDATYVARTFASAMDRTTGTLSALLAVAVTSATYKADLVFALSGPIGTDPSVWLIDAGQRRWTPLPFTPANLPATLQSLTQTGPTVEGLYIEMGIDSTAPAVALAAVRDPALAGVQDMFVLNVAGGAGSWSYSLQEHTIGGLEGLDEGRMHYSSAWGIYKLYALNGQPALTFLPLKASFGPGPGTPTSFVVDATASALASLAYQPATGQTCTDLFVAVNGGIDCYPYNASEGSAGVQVIRSPLVSGVTQLHAVNAGDTAFLWGVNGSGAVFYARAPLAQIEQPGGWSTPVPLLTGVTAASALVGAPADECGVCALAPLAAGVTTGSATTAPTLLALNPVTGHWESQVLPMPSTGDCITLKTYTTRVQLMDGSAPVAGATIQAAANVDCTLVINGLAAQVAAGSAVSLTTDMSGSLSFVYAVSSLAGATFTLTLPDGTQEVVHAAQDVATRLSSLDSDTLTRATYRDASGATVNVVASGTGTGAVSGVAAATASLAASSATLPPASHTPLARRRLAAQSLSAGVGDGSILMEIGDLVQFIGHVVEEVAGVMLQELETGWRIVVTVAEDVFSAVIQTAEDALHAIVAVFRWIGAEFEALFRWLAFLFDWSDIVAVHKELVAAYNQLLTSLRTDMLALTGAVTTYLAHVKDEVLATFEPATAFAAVSGAASPSAAYNAQAPVPPPVNNVNLHSDARIGWVNDRASTPPSSTQASHAARAAAAAPAGALPELDAALATLLTSLETLVSDLAGDVLSLAEGKLSPQQFLTAVITQLAETGIDDLTTVATALGAATDDVIPLVQQALNAEIDVPVLSALYRAATGDELSVLDLTCLIQAIAFTIVYKIATDQSPLAALQSLDLPTTLATVSAELPAQVTAAAGGQADVALVARRRTSAPAAGDDRATTLNVVTGCLLVVQGISTFALGCAELTGATPFVKGTYLLDLFTRQFRGSLECDDAASREYGGANLVQVESAFHSLLGVAVCYLVANGNLASLPTLMTVDETVSLGWGAWEIRNMCADEIDTDAGHIFETAIELTELPSSLLCHAAHAADPPNLDLTAAAFTFVGLRSIAAMGAGIMRATGA